MLTPLSSRWTPTVQSVVRFVVGLLFVVHGTQKLFGVPVPLPGGPADLESLLGVAGVIETVGGTLLFLGLFTRPMAFLLSGEMAAAYFMQHAPRGFWPLVNGGELAVLYCFIFLFFAAAGAGPISLDAMIAARRSHLGQAPLHPPHTASGRA
jgi:putative oxidoreductase